jgi:gliding motility-associated-like protein
MKRAKTIYFYVLTIVMACQVTVAKADHITGGEMYYVYGGVQSTGYMYRVTLRLLMRCNSGRNFPNPIQISIFSKGTNARIQNFSVPLGSQQNLSLSNTNPCISNPPVVCYEVATYNFEVIVPSSPQGYIVSAQVNFRINGLSNLAFGASSIGATYTAEIPGTLSLDEAFINSSAQFTGSDLVVVCANSPFTYSFAANDADEDKLRYSFCAAYQTGTSGGGGMNNEPPQAPPYPLVPYRQGFDGTMPLANKVIIDPVSGLITGIAPDAGYYVITVCVEEIRDGVVIAVQRKDIQLNITNCTVAAALLQPKYQLCGDLDAITFENLSISPLIQTYAWRITNRQGSTIANASTPQFTFQFTDTGFYKVFLNTNNGLPCPDLTSSEVRVYPGFKAAFSFVGLCFGNPTRFADNSSLRYGAISGRTWNLGESGNPQNNPQGLNPSIIYQSLGNKTASLRIENTNGCVDSITKVLPVSKDPPLQLPFRDTLICQPDTLMLSVLGDGIFTWQPLVGIISGANTATPRVAPIITTRYKVTQRVDDCIGTDSIDVRVVSSVSLTTMKDTAICAGDSIQLRISANANLFLWTPTLNIRNANLAQPMVAPTATTKYKVVASISKCQAQGEVVVTTVPYPLLSVGPDQLICFGNTVQLSSSTNGNRMEWTPSNLLSNGSIPNPIASPKQTTAYVLKVFDDEGCPKPSMDTVLVIVDPPIVLSIFKDTSIVVGQLLQFNASGAPKYRWVPSFGLSSDTASNPTARYSRPQDELKYVLIGYNNAGCRDSLTVRIRVYANGPSIYVPTAFTPNADGLNETLKPTIAGMKGLNYFRIFNRYGNLIYDSKTTKNGWDGTYKGQKQAAGLFVWSAQAVDYEGKIIQAKGSTMLIR